MRREYYKRLMKWKFEGEYIMILSVTCPKAAAPLWPDDLTWLSNLLGWSQTWANPRQDPVSVRWISALLIWSWRIGQLSQMISLTSILLTLMWHERFTGWRSDLWMSRRCAQLKFGFVRGFGFGWDALWSLDEMDQKHYWFKRNHLY